MNPRRLAWNGVYWLGAATLVTGVFAVLVVLCATVVLRWRPATGKWERDDD